ncbi:MAG: hypothetical protein VX265_17480, partial [Myxococcota bacterium]|nr:hypothetical protein [Myxococcota bacterium]
MNRRPSVVRAVLIPVLLYTVVAALLTWPVVIAPLDHAPGARRTDLWNALWVLSWQAETLGAGILPYEVTALNHPEGGTLMPADPLSFVWSVVVVPMLGPVLT